MPDGLRHCSKHTGRISIYNWWAAFTKSAGLELTPKQAGADECLLAELQENNARKELTGAERKAFAAEVGRIIAKLAENCQSGIFAIGKDGVIGNWVDDLAKTSSTPVKTIYNWWAAFTKEAGLGIPGRRQ